MRVKVTFYEARFHTVEVEAEDVESAEREAHSRVSLHGHGYMKSRGLVRWNVEERAPDVAL